MSSPTNLTDSLTQLRERNESGDTTITTPSGRPSGTSERERRFATDLFMLFAYGLLSLAIICQLFLIVWLDII